MGVTNAELWNNLGLCCFYASQVGGDPRPRTVCSWGVKRYALCMCMRQGENTFGAILRRRCKVCIQTAHPSLPALRRLATLHS